MIANIARKLDTGDRLSEADLVELLSPAQLMSLMTLADRVRRARHGTRTTFLRVQQVAGSGPVPPRVPGAGELQIVGAAPNLQAALARIEAALIVAGDAPVSAFELSDLERLAVDEGLPLRTLLEHLREAGLELVADAAIDRLAHAEAAIEAVNMAGLILARLSLAGMPRQALVDGLRQVADLQRSVGVVRAFRPLARTLSPEHPTTGYADIREVALARLLVDNVEMLQIDWTLFGPKLAQVALAAGADDLDQVPASDLPGSAGSAAAEVRTNIEAAGLTPAERNGRFDLR